MKELLIGLFFLTALQLWTQNPTKKTLGHEELVTWNRIQQQKISNDGNWVSYQLAPEEGNKTLKLWDAKKGLTITFERGMEAQFSHDNQYLAFKLKTSWDSLRLLKLAKTKKEDLPKDTLVIYHLPTGKTEKISHVQSFRLPEKWSGWLVYHKAVEELKKTESLDSTQQIMPDSMAMKKPKKSAKKPKKEGKKTGTKLVIRNLSNMAETVVPFVKNYVVAKEGARVLMNSTGKDSTFIEGVYLFDCATESLSSLIEKEGTYQHLMFDERGSQAAFLMNLDTTENRIPPFALAYWSDDMEAAKIIADTMSKVLPIDWRVSEHGKPVFSKNGAKLYFGIAPNPVLPDTTKLDTEVAKVEVWHWEDAMLHTQQNNRLESEKKRTYQVVWHIAENKMVQLGTKDLPEIRLGDEGNANVVLGYQQADYYKQISWEGFPARRDAYIIDTKNWKRSIIGKNIKGNTTLSPKAKFVIWYDVINAAWYTYNVATKVTKAITNNDTVKYYNEVHDIPASPYPYGIAGWTSNDEFVLIYDRYDIWKIDPNGQLVPQKLTNGRAGKLRYRYVKLDNEERNIDLSDKLMLHVFDEKTKGGGFAALDGLKGETTNLIFDEDFRFRRRPIKARNAEAIVFQKENFQVFPDMHYTNLSFDNSQQISRANPQQGDYSWGNIELHHWTDLNGQKLAGMLVKPENFDPTKQYPMIVNFYEKSSDRLHYHRTPLPGRSTINYPFYASKGYLIFNPDVPYREGYPGESALNAVLSGVTSLIDKGFVDKARIGVQGHSWGGYQVAYLINHTDIFRCAESGAPVVNMFSAYGGIRWGSGLSRMFQYEKTQSRIGGTIWEYPLRYIENSPIFDLDKCNTPVLIMHNDKDGAVPWYQGIEYFVGLRRLSKPAWLLNYNDEPHWPVKLANRRDFNIRMQQFFDFYLKDAPAPKWMERGVPAIEKGILQGYELESKE